MRLTFTPWKRKDKRVHELFWNIFLAFEWYLELHIYLYDDDLLACQGSFVNQPLHDFDYQYIKIYATSINPTFFQ